LTESKIRQLCAQSAMLYFKDAVNNYWMDIGTSSVDDYYYKTLGRHITSLAGYPFGQVHAEV